jgi:hypothetical protein
MALCSAWCAAPGCHPPGDINYCCAQHDCRGCSDDEGCSKPPPPPSPPWAPPQPPGTPAPPLTPPLAPQTNSYWVDHLGQIRTTAFDIDTDDRALRIRGVSVAEHGIEPQRVCRHQADMIGRWCSVAGQWFGLESRVCYVGGGDSAPISTSAAWLRTHGFNAVRIPLAMNEVLAGAAGRGSDCLKPEVYTNPNPEMVGLSYLDGLTHWIRILGEHGLLVLLVRATGNRPRVPTSEPSGVHDHTISVVQRAAALCSRRAAEPWSGRTCTWTLRACGPMTASSAASRACNKHGLSLHAASAHHTSSGTSLAPT